MKFKEVIKLIRNDGCYFVRQTGSHKQFHHKQKTGTVTIAGKIKDDIHPKTLKSILLHAQIKNNNLKIMKEFLIIVEKGKKNLSAYAPDLPGCIATADTEEEILLLMKEGIELHISDMKERGYKIPPPDTKSFKVEIAA